MLQIAGFTSLLGLCIYVIFINVDDAGVQN